MQPGKGQLVIQFGVVHKRFPNGTAAVHDLSLNMPAGRRSEPSITCEPDPAQGGYPQCGRGPGSLTLVSMTGWETAMDARDTDLKKELDATLQTRRELGEEYESALVDSFLEKVDQRIDGAVERRVRRQFAEQQMVAARGSRAPRPTDSWGDRFGFGIVSLILAIPLSAIGGSFANFSGVLATWVGIVGVNCVQAARTNPELFAGRRRRSAGRDDDWKD